MLSACSLGLPSPTWATHTSTTLIGHLMRSGRPPSLQRVVLTAVANTGQTDSTAGKPSHSRWHWASQRCSSHGGRPSSRPRPRQPWQLGSDETLSTRPSLPGLSTGFPALLRSCTLTRPGSIPSSALPAFPRRPSLRHLQAWVSSAGRTRRGCAKPEGRRAGGRLGVRGSGMRDDDRPV